VGTGILQNPEDSGGILSKYMNSCPQEFLRKIHVKLKKKKKKKRRKKKKSSGILSETVFWTQKINS